ncbi:MAG: ABC transporter ATP-binding protein [Pseudomonadota bacterium]
MIAVDGLSKSFGDLDVLQNISLSFGKGETVAIIGKSGVGKSTLARIIAGVDKSYQGRVSAPDRIGYVFQEPTLLPWRRVLANLTLFHPDLPDDTAREMLARVDLDNKASQWPRQLSLGQQRRLALARAFMGDPELLLLDEPYTSLDSETHEDMLALTETLIDQVRPAVLIVTHNTLEATRLAQRTYELRGSPATLQTVPA